MRVMLEQEKIQGPIRSIETVPTWFPLKDCLSFRMLNKLRHLPFSKLL